MQRKNISSHSPWEKEVGYSRAVRVGSFIFVAGTTASDENGKVVGADDSYTQTVYCIKKIRTALLSAGSDLSHVVRTRMFVTNIRDWKEIARAHSEFFREIKPAATLIQVSRLMIKKMLIEIEVDALDPS